MGMTVEIELEEEIKVWHRSDGKTIVRFDGANETFDNPDEAQEAIRKYLEGGNEYDIAAFVANHLIEMADGLAPGETPQ